MKPVGPFAIRWPALSGLVASHDPGADQTEQKKEFMNTEADDAQSVSGDPPIDFQISPTTAVIERASNINIAAA